MRFLWKKGGLLFVIIVGVIYLFMKPSQTETPWQNLTDAEKQEVITLLAETKPEEMYFPSCLPEGMRLYHAEAITDGDTVSVECYFQNNILGQSKRLDVALAEMTSESLWFLQSNDAAYVAKQSGMEDGLTLQEGTYQFQENQLGNTLCWKQGNLICILRGEMQEKDMKKIAESIQPI